MPSKDGKSIKLPWKLLKDDAGQALVELALTAPMLLVFLLGAGEFARVAYAAIEVTNAANAAVRYGSQNLTTAANTAAIQAAAASDAGNLTLGTTTVTYQCSCSDGSVGWSSCTGFSCASGKTVGRLNVTTTATFDPGIHIVNLPIFHVTGLPTTFTLNGHATSMVLY